MCFSQDAWTDELRENEGKTQGGDDMGMGVSNTVKKKRRADPKYASITTIQLLLGVS